MSGARVLGIGDKVFFAGSLTRDDLSLCFFRVQGFRQRFGFDHHGSRADRGHRQRLAGHFAASQRKCGP